EIVKENGVEHIDLLKIDVEKGEYDVLKGIEDSDWPKIKQLVIEVHDVRLKEIVTLLSFLGYKVNCEQDRHLRNTLIYNLYAVRPPSRGRAANMGDVPGEIAGKRIWTNQKSL